MTTPDHGAPPRSVTLDGSALRIREVVGVARLGWSVALAPDRLDVLRAARAEIDRIASDGAAHYGVNTGFGSLSRTRVDADHLNELQTNLIRSHAAGVGAPLPLEVVRGMMLVLAASLVRGASGVRPVLVETLLACLNQQITPVVPETGSVGASGDLAPLAHLSLVLLGEGEAWYRGSRIPGSQALAQAAIEPIRLEPKEGLALINGTHLMAARAALLAHDATRVFRASIVAGAMSIDACKATDSFLNDRVAELRRHEGVRRVASDLRLLLAGSEIIPSHRENDPRVQDPYSLRCQPQVMGAVYEVMASVHRSLHQELGAVTDNPLLVGEQDGSRYLVSAGNFHGMPIALPLDSLTPAVAHLAGMAERRVFYMLAGTDAEAALSPYLATRPGLTSGLMIVQYTAAACCNEIIGLSAPASVANLSTSAGIEDYNSFGPRAAAKAARAVELARAVVAIELLCAAEAIEHHRPLRTGDRLETAHARVRATVPRLKDDRPPAPDIESIAGLIARGAFDDLLPDHNELTSELA
ncbi:MAG: histidine ammonia-lyase [Phycisphaerales bacterium]